MGYLGSGEVIGSLCLYRKTATKLLSFMLFRLLSMKN